MTTTDNLGTLLKEARERDITSEQLDDSVNSTVRRILAKDSAISASDLDVEAAWEADKINETGIEAQIEYLLEHHEFRWLHELLLDL
jgi:hypothetical protein